MDLNEIGKIYYIGITKGLIGTQDLKRLGYNSYRIKKLVDQGIIKPITNKRGVYQITDINSIYSLGVRELKGGNRAIAEKYLEKCYELDPSHSDISYYLFCLYVLKRDFNKAITYAPNALKTVSGNRLKNMRYFLFIAEFFMDVEAADLKDIRNTKIEDIELAPTESNSSSIDNRNRMRSLVFQGFFRQPIKTAVESLNGKFDLPTEVELTLLVAADRHKIKYSADIFDAVRRGDFQDVIDILKSEEKRPRQTKNEKMIAELAKIGLSLRSGHMPKVTPYDGMDTYTAILYRDLERAYELSYHYSNRSNYNLAYNNVAILIDAIMKEMLYFKAADTHPKLLDSSLESLYAALIANDSEKTDDLLLNYLINKNIPQYYEALKKLKAICVLSQDTSYTKFIDLLTSLEPGDWIAQIDDFIKLFDTFMREGNIDGARLVFDFIKDMFSSDELLDVTEFIKILEELNKKLTAITVGKPIQ